MPQPLIELNHNPDAPVMNIAPANGFVPELYIPILRPFFDDYRVVCVPPRALWGDQEPPEITDDSGWEAIGHDFYEGIREHNLSDMIYIGHSIGAIVSMLMLLEDESPFKAVIMLDPTVLVPNILDMLRMVQPQGMAYEHPLSKGALRRRHQFDSIDAVYDNFKSKRIFSDWDDEVLRLYAEHGTVPNDEGRTLRYTGAWEAYYFASGFTRTWDILPKLNQAKTPMYIINGGTSDTFIPESVEKVRELVPSADYATVEGHGHLFPMSAPRSTSELIQDWLGKHNIANG